jgi:DNA-binding IclR family transcriptional regulator
MTKTYLVPAIERALRIMEYLANSKRGFSLSEISRNLGFPKSSVHLVLGTLETMGYLQKDAQKGRYSFGLKLVSLSRSALENLDLRQVARPFMQALAQQSGLTVHLAILERGEAVIIEKIEAPGFLKLATWVGRRLDVNCTGVGKALIAFLPDEELDRRINPRTLTRHNDRSIVSIRALKRELLEVRKVGYAFDDEEDEIGLRCVGAAVFDSTGNPVAGLSVAGTVNQIPLERVASLGKKVGEAAATISSNLGFVRGQLANAAANVRT